MKQVIVFGATSAIAQAVCRRFASAGAKLFLVARNPERLEAIAADLRVRGASLVQVEACDLSDCDAHEALIGRARQGLDKIDCALIAYGTLPDQKACEEDFQTSATHILVNYLSPVSLLTHMANVMALQGSGTIGVIGSVAGDRGRQSNYVYGSAKGGLAVFTQGLRHRLWSKGVAVVLIKPGFVDTPMTAGIAKGGPLWASPEKVAGDIVRALDSGKAVLYTPWFWRWIMAVIRIVPDFVFRRTKL
jgi:short-subunit dehydrogenase